MSPIFLFLTMPEQSKSEPEDEAEEAYDHELMSLTSVAERRALLLQRAAKANAAGAPPKQPSLLPSALDLLGAQRPGQLPRHLDPEATRRLPGAALPSHTGPTPADARGAAGSGVEAADDPLAKLAPKLVEERKRPAAVISAAPKRTRLDEDAHAAVHAGRGPAMPPPEVPVKGKGGAKSIPTEEFVAKGGKLPRKTDQAKDKEKNRRAKGQSTFDRWKSEEEFALRQNFDS